MKLRTLQTVDGFGASPANKVVMSPVKLTGAIENIIKSVQLHYLHDLLIRTHSSF